GVRFLPLYGKSGSGKSCAAAELATHLPQTRVIHLSHAEIESNNTLQTFLAHQKNLFSPTEMYICIIDQYEETVDANARIPEQFVEKLSLLDRSEFAKQPMLFIW